MQARRAQPAITIRSARAVERLRLLTETGRSQAAVIEEALDRMPLPADSPTAKARYDRLTAVLAKVTRTDIPSMAEFDASEYDENGNPR